MTDIKTSATVGAAVDDASSVLEHLLFVDDLDDVFWVRDRAKMRGYAILEVTVGGANRDSYVVIGRPFRENDYRAEQKSISDFMRLGGAMSRLLTPLETRAARSSRAARLRR